MKAAVDFFSNQISGIVCGSVTAGLVETVRVPYHGESVPIKHVANTSNRGNTILVTPFDPLLTKHIETVLKNSGYAAYVLSKTSVCVNCPPVGQSERDRVTKQIKKLAEDARIAIRNVRKKAKKDLDAIPESEKEIKEKVLQKATDEHVKLIDGLSQQRINFISR